MSKRLLVGIPCVLDGGQLRRALECIVHKENVDVVVVNNSAGIDKTVSMVLLEYSDKVYVIRNPCNFYVNRSWSQIMQHFLERPEYEYLIIMNSDLSLQQDWDSVCRNRWAVNPNEILIPTIAEPREVETKVLEGIEVQGGVAGIFITMSREQVELAHPLPYEQVKVWYGDDIIYGLCTAAGYTMTIVPNLLAEHQESSSVRQVKGVYEIIDQDKIAWAETVKPMMEEKIKQLKEPKRKELSLDYAIFSSDYFDLSFEDAMTKFPSHAEQIKDYFKINLERNNNAT